MEHERFAGFDHVDLRVRELAAARRFYDVLLPALGLTDIVEDAGEAVYFHPHVLADAPRPFVGLHEDPAHIPTETCLAFSAGTPAEVDRLAGVARTAGASDMEGPEIPFSFERYYAVFFRDPSGNRIEICYRRAHDNRNDAVVTPGRSANQ